MKEIITKTKEPAMSEMKGGTFEYAFGQKSKLLSEEYMRALSKHSIISPSQDVNYNIKATIKGLGHNKIFKNAHLRMFNKLNKEFNLKSGNIDLPLDLKNYLESELTQENEVDYFENNHDQSKTEENNFGTPKVK